MKNLYKSLLLSVAVALGSTPVSLEAGKTAHITGGGQGTFDADLDGDGDIDGSHFGIGIDVLGSGAARGHFTCLMAGNQDFLGLHLMLVEGPVESATVDPEAGTGFFSGSGSLHINGEKQDAMFMVDILQEGGPGVGRFQLTVVDASGGVIVFPPETVERGQIAVH